MDTAALLKDNRTFVPLRFVSEALGATVEWKDDIKTVYITTNGTTPTPSNGTVSKYNGYSVPSNSQLHVTGNDEFCDQGFMISFYKENADVVQQAIDVKNAIASKLGSKIADEVYEYIKGKTTPQYEIKEKFFYVESTKQVIWVQESPKGLKTIDILISLPGKNFDRV
jgi:hypothetical protein